jgi:hypothetical protein
VDASCVRSIVRLCVCVCVFVCLQLRSVTTPVGEPMCAGLTLCPLEYLIEYPREYPCEYPVECPVEYRDDCTIGERRWPRVASA